MDCPVCHSPNCYVIESREKSSVRRRRYKCSNCNSRFTSLETIWHVDINPDKQFLNIIPQERGPEFTDDFSAGFNYCISEIKRKMDNKTFE